MNAPSLPWRGFLWVNLACLCWAGNLVAGRLLRDVIGPGLLVGLRTALAAVLLAALWRVLRSRSPGRGRRSVSSHWGLLVLMAGTGIVGYQGLLYGALHTTGALNAALINACAPLVTAALSWVVYGTRLSRGAFGGIVLSMLGIAVILSGGDAVRLLSLRLGRGDLLVLVAVVLWAVYSLAARKVMQDRSVIDSTALVTALALPLAAPWIVMEGSWRQVEWTAGLLAGVAYVAVFASVVAMLAWNRAVSLVGAASAAASMNMLPLYALLSSLVLREPLQAAQAAGGVMIVAGCLWAALSPPPSS